MREPEGQRQWRLMYQKPREQGCLQVGDDIDRWKRALSEAAINKGDKVQKIYWICTLKSKLLSRRSDSRPRILIHACLHILEVGEM